MKYRVFLLSTLIMFSLAGYSHGQNWAGILSPSRAVDWSGAGVVGGIPTNRANCVTTQCNTLYGGSVTAATINAAIQSAPDSTVVRIPAGTFTVGGITFAGKNNVTLRGAGPDQTRLNFNGYSACTGSPNAPVCFKGDLDLSPADGMYGVVHSWTGATSWPQGTTQVTLDSVASMGVGQWVTFDQLDDSASGANYLSITPGLKVCTTVNVCSQEGSSGTRAGRAQTQAVQIAAINGNTITFSPGLYLSNWRSSQSPQLWTWGTVGQTRYGNGLEGVTIDGTNSGGQSNVTMNNVHDCWVRNIRSLTPSNYHVWALDTVHDTVADSYFYQTGAAQTTAYGWHSYESGGYHLVINNIWQQINNPIMEQNGVGTVIAYNFTVNDAMNDDWMRASYDLHNSHVSMDLVEGNYGATFHGDTFHGTTDMFTVFRNRFTGMDWGTSSRGGSAVTKANDLIPFNSLAGSRYHNVIGNVLGTAGQHTQYEETTSNGTYNNSIYVNGFTGQADGNAFGSRDPYVSSTMMRWGNYDTAGGATRWNSSEVPTGLSDYPNAVPASQTLPASLFLNATPGWWGVAGQPAIPWPPVGPDVTGGNGPGGHSYDIPTRVCYLSVMHGPADGSGGLLTFNADNCYPASSSASAPNPPTNLVVKVQ